MTNFAPWFAAAFLVAALPFSTQSITLDEIVVTAQKRGQNLQDVGVYITAMSDDPMRKFGFKNSSEIVAHAPSVQKLQLASTDQVDVAFGNHLRDSFNGLITRDADMAFAPGYDMNSLARYRWPLAGGELSTQVDFRYADTRYNEKFRDPTCELDKYLGANALIFNTPASGNSPGPSPLVRHVAAHELKLIPAASQG